MFFRRRRKRAERLNETPTIFSRVTNLLRANIHAELDKAEDPEKMLDLYVRDFKDAIAEARESVAKSISHLRLDEHRAIELQQEIDASGQRAEMASLRAQRAKKPAEAEKYNRLAVRALKEQMQHEQTLSATAQRIESQTNTVEQLKYGLTGLDEKLHDLESKRTEIVARHRAVEAQEQIVHAIGAANVNDKTSEVSRYEQQLSEREALAAGRAEVAALSFSSEFDELDDLGTMSELERRLDAIKHKQRQEIQP